MNQDYQFDPGQDAGSYQPVNLTPTGHARGYGITSLVMGILAVLSGTCCCCCYYVSIVFGVLAIVFACLSKRDGGKMRGIAVAGLVMGIIGIVLFVAWMIVSRSVPEMSDEELIHRIEQVYKDKFGVDIDLDEYMNGITAQEGK